MYHCYKCGYDLHPCCAKLPTSLHDGEVSLYLYRKVSAPCHKCGRKGRSWSYRSKCKKYNLHVACVMEMLMENWQNIYVGRGERRISSEAPSVSFSFEAPSVSFSFEAPSVFLEHIPLFESISH